MGLERGTVALEPYRPAWRDRYETEVARLRRLLGDRVCGFEHVGSTAVEGLPAKPVVDMLALVEQFDNARDLVGDLEANGYELRPDEAVSGRLFFAKGPRTDRTHYLSVTERESAVHTELVAFRDYLRANPDVAAEYAALKRDLAAQYPDDRAAYTEQKSMFVEAVLDRATDP